MFEHFLHKKRVIKSRSTLYNPSGNGQVERYNHVIWKDTIIHLNNQRISYSKLPNYLARCFAFDWIAFMYSLCRATNKTPHKRFFPFLRRSSVGGSISTCLTKPGPVF